MNNDLISRSALKKALKSNCDVCNDKNTNWCEHCCPNCGAKTKGGAE